MSEAADHDAERRCLTGLAVAACALDQKLHIVFQNTAAAEFFRSPVPLEKWPFLQQVHPGDRSSIQQELESIWSEPGSYVLSCRAGCEGNWSQIDLTLGPLLADGLRLAVMIPKRLSAPAVHLAGTASDPNSSSIRPEDQAEVWRRFAYTVAHDLKVPLVTMEGNLRLMQQDLDAGQTASLAEDLAEVDEAVRKMKRLVVELLDLARIGRLDLIAAAQSRARDRIKLDELVDGVIKEVVAVHPSWNGSINRVTGLPEVCGHSIQLTEVFQNLIDNALKYSSGVEAPRVEISGRPDEHGTTVAVRDNGCGIQRHDRNRVFDLFVQLRPDAPGVGVGLSIVRSIVSSHGGRVWIEDGLDGRGVCVCVFLPTTE